MSTVVVVGGTSGIGREIARHYAEAGDRVALTGRDAERTAAVAKEIGGDTTGIALDLALPYGIGPALAGIGAVDSLVLAAIERDVNTVADYDIDRAIRLVTLKLVGYTEVVHPGFVEDSPYWRDRDLSHVVARTPCGRLAQMADIVDAVAFLLRNRAVNGVSLTIDGGWLLG